MVIYAPKGPDEYRENFFKVNNCLHRLLINGFSQFEPKNLEPLKIVTMVPNRLRLERQRLLNDYTFEQRYRFSQLATVGSFFLFKRSWTGFFIGTFSSAYFLCPELYSVFNE